MTERLRRLCPHCRQPFTPSRGARGRRQVACGLARCKALQSGAARKGKPNLKVRTKLRQKANAQIQARLRTQFGELSVREIELFRWAWQSAWRRGYDIGRRPSCQTVAA